MKVFISWSGERSKRIAEVLRKWLPSVLQSIKVYYSEDDIRKGTRWVEEISKELEGNHFGLLCVTRESLHSDWLMFEAGALSKNLATGRVCPVLFDLEPTDVTGPLQNFQACKFEKKEWKALVKELNALLGDQALEDEILENTFEHWWSDLEAKVCEILTTGSDDGEEAVRSDHEMIAEVLAIVRDLSRIESPRGGPVSLESYEAVMAQIKTLIDNATEEQSVSTLGEVDVLLDFLKPVLRPITSEALKGGSIRFAFKEAKEQIRERIEQLAPSPVSEDDIPF